MLTRQERQEIIKRAKEHKGEELIWDQIAYVLLGVPCWRNDDELLDCIMELCEVSTKDQPAFKPTVDELYLQALKAKHDCLAAYRQRNVTTQTLDECKCDFDAAIRHYKQLVEKEQQC